VIISKTTDSFLVTTGDKPFTEGREHGPSTEAKQVWGPKNPVVELRLKMSRK
jgi:hypothetical protein